MTVKCGKLLPIASNNCLSSIPQFLWGETINCNCSQPHSHILFSLHPQSSIRHITRKECERLKDPPLLKTQSNINTDSQYNHGRLVDALFPSCKHNRVSKSSSHSTHPPILQPRWSLGAPSDPANTIDYWHPLQSCKYNIILTSPPILQLISNHETTFQLQIISLFPSHSITTIEIRRPFQSCKHNLILTSPSHPANYMESWRSLPPPSTSNI